MLQPPRARENANGPIDGYIVIYKRTKLGGQVLDKVAKFEKVVAKGGNANFNLSGLLPWSTYDVQIAAFNLETKRNTIQIGKKLISRFSDPFTVLTRVSGLTLLFFLGIEFLVCFCSVKLMPQVFCF